MAVKLRLMRMGKKKQPTYRVVAADTRAARNGGFIEIVGTYQPRLEPSGFRVDDAKVLKWLRNGAKPSETVEKLLRISGTWELFESGAEAPDPTPEPAAAESSAAESPAAESSDS